MSSRRRFLKETLPGVVMLSFTRGVTALQVTGPSAKEENGKLRYFSSHEFSVMEAIAACMIGLNETNEEPPGPAAVALRADSFLADADPEIQDQMHLLLTVFSASLFTFLFDFRLSSFLDMNREQRESYTHDWMTSRLGFRRTGFQALKRISLSMYYTDGRSWDGISYHGMFLPEGVE